MAAGLVHAQDGSRRIHQTPSMPDNSHLLLLLLLLLLLPPTPLLQACTATWLL
jgi:hypothetical protein